MRFRFFAPALALGLTASSATAATLQVSPVNVEVKAPAAASVLTLRNLDSTPINAQIRVFRWTQQNGQDVLAPATGVVASPPAAQILPGSDYTVRIVRIDKSPVAAEETYRLLVDQVPDPAAVKGDAVNFAIRYSIPVFFETGAMRPQIAWKARMKNGRLWLSGSNQGRSRLRVAALSVSDSAGNTVSFGQGLVGYVLAGSTVSWGSKRLPANFARDGKLTIKLRGEHGPVQATAMAGGAD